MRHFFSINAAALICALAPFAGATEWEGLPASVAEIAVTAPAIPEPTLTPPERVRTVVCVDPGHPNSFNSGLQPVNGTTETHINWVVGVKLEKVLKDLGYDVVMTRADEKKYVENKDRALICNAGGAALSVHLHCESTPGSGFALYYPDRIGTHNYKDDPDNGFKGPSAQVMAGSKTLAETVSKGMKEKLAGTLPSRGVFGDSRTAVGASQGALTFSIFSKIPTLTIEMAVLTNKSDAALMKTEQGQLKMANAIAAGILLYKAP
jgi:N-acetylmuramoyl-L-alanine amidase